MCDIAPRSADSMMRITDFALHFVHLGVAALLIVN